jgi:hypothetical protein
VAGIEPLVRAYSKYVSIPWQMKLAPPQRVWMVVYPPQEERRLRARVQEFEIGTVKAGHRWDCVDLTDEFARWLSAHPYRDAYFESPELLDEAGLDDFGDHLARTVEASLATSDENGVVGLLGVGSLFSLYRVSRLLERVVPSVPGRLLVFFPGERDGANYRMLEAQDGWNYLATPIEPTEDKT